MGFLTKKQKNARRINGFSKESQKRIAQQNLERARGPLFSRALRDAEVTERIAVDTTPQPYNDGRNNHLNISSNNADPVAKKKSKRKVVLSAEMQQREELAQEEIERKKLRTAPAYNKGAYQYITDEQDLTEIGRKT